MDRFNVNRIMHGVMMPSKTLEVDEDTPLKLRKGKNVARTGRDMKFLEELQNGKLNIARAKYLRATYWIRRMAAQLFLSSIPVAVLSIFFRQLVVGERTITAIINFIILGGSSAAVAYLYFEMDQLAKAKVRKVKDHPLTK